MRRLARCGTGLGLAIAVVLAVLLPPAQAVGGTAPAPGAREPMQPREAVERFVTLWRIGDYGRMHEVLAAADRERYTPAGFTDLHQRFAAAIGLTGMHVAIGSARATARPPEARPPDVPALIPAPSAPSEDESPAPTIDVGGVVAGPVPAMAVNVRLTFDSRLLGTIVLDRALDLTLGPTGWEVRWTPETLFPELGSIGGAFRVERGPLPPRGKIIAADGTVLALTRPDGVRVYPRDSLAGQVVGYATPLTAEEAAARAAIDGYAAGQVAGRRGVEAGAEALLRGRPSMTLVVEPFAAPERTVVERPLIPGADVRLTIQPDLQRSAEVAIAGYPEAATAVVDPRSGDVWALASAPAFNPNAMTLGTTYAGSPLSRPTAAQLQNHALETAYPTGSSFKPFTLAAAFQTGVASPATRMTCLPTWDFGGVRFVNYELHQLPGLVSLQEAMAFSCNTTYMPLSMVVYEHDRDALTDLIADFGFGQPTGIGWVPETGGVLPDALYFEGHRRGSGSYSPFGPFDQVQLAIGQGSFLGTQLQMALAYAAFANRGTLWMPRLVTTAVTPDGDVVHRSRSQIRHRIAMDRADLDYLVTALQAVTTYSYGTGTAAFAGFGIPVAGKSGTAESGGPDPHALFPAFAPAVNPEIVVATLLARVHLGTGGSDSAPLVRRVMTTYFNR
jgi:cell division protein FtsI/penicillin-binding protein 2